MALDNQLVYKEIIEEQKKQITNLKEQNKLFVKRICQLQAALVNEKNTYQKLKACYNCKADYCKGCENLSGWRFVGDI